MSYNLAAQVDPVRLTEYVSAAVSTVYVLAALIFLGVVANRNYRPVKRTPRQQTFWILYGLTTLTPLVWVSSWPSSHNVAVGVIIGIPAVRIVLDVLRIVRPWTEHTHKDTGISHALAVICVLFFGFSVLLADPWSINN